MSWFSKKKMNEQDYTDEEILEENEMNTEEIPFSGKQREQ